MLRLLIDGPLKAFKMWEGGNMISMSIMGNLRLCDPQVQAWILNWFRSHADIQGGCAFGCGE